MGSVRPMSLSAGEVFAGYTVVRPLGSGGMGEVYLATHPRLPRQDAIKVLPASVSADADFRTRFEREADLAATLWHPHIVGVHDRGEDEGRLWIAMDYVEGSDAARLSREHHPGGMPVQDVVEIVMAVADALDHAHQRSLLHRDVKPANILLTEGSRERRRILLADFGIARHTDDATGLTATNMTVGSVFYTAPEQLIAEGVDGRADQYSLAATAFHLLTGNPPFPQTNTAAVISRHLSTPPPALGQTHSSLAALDAVIARGMAKDPADRYDTCLDFATALSESASGTSIFDATSPPTTAAPVESATTFFATAQAPAADQTERSGPPPVTVASWDDPVEEAAPPPHQPQAPAPHQPAPRQAAPQPEHPANTFNGPVPMYGPPQQAVHPAVLALIVAALIALVAAITFAVMQATYDGNSAATHQETTIG